MPASDVRQRQKSSLKQQNGEKRRSEDEEEEERTTTKKESVAREALTVDVRLCVSALCLALSVLIAWLHVQQSHTLAELRGQYESLREKSRRGAEQLDEKISRVSEQCALLSAPEGSPSEALTAEVALLEGRFSGLQRDLMALGRALEEAEGRTLQVSGDVNAKVASIRTDLRRMAGLQTEVEALLQQTDALEEKVSQTEKLLVRRVGDLLAGSIDRVSALRSSAERSGQRLERVSALVQQLSAEHRKLAERILALESGQAKLRRTLTFADDLKPKVFTIRQDFALVEPRLADLTLRIGLLAEDMMGREGELEESAGREEARGETTS